MSSTSRYVVEDTPMFDSNTGKDGGVRLIYSGEARRHPWPSRREEFVMDGEGVAKLVNGDTYVGGTSLGMFHGNGNMVYANGDVYEGQWLNNVRHGFGVLDTVEGASYVGSFKFGDKDGAGEETYADGTTFDGIFRDGLRNGLGRIRVKSSGDIIDGVFVQGRLTGLVTVTYGHGDIFIGKFVNGVPHGEGKYTQVDSGDVYTERFQRGRCVMGVLELSENPVGDLEKYSEARKFFEAPIDEPLEERQQVCSVVYKATGDTYVGQWKREATGSNRRGVRHGVGTLTYKSTGDKYEGPFENDMREGQGTLWFAPPVSTSTDASEAPAVDTDVVSTVERRPVVYRGMFHLDLMDGPGSIEYNDGSTTQQFFSKGQPHGLCHEFTPLMDFSLPPDVRYYPSVHSFVFERGVSLQCRYGMDA